MANKFYVDGLTVEQILALDPADMAKLNKREISRALRTVSLAANKRIEKLEKYAKKTKHGYIPNPKGGKSIATDALNWVSSDGTTKPKFGVRRSENRNQMIAQIGKVRQFMNMKTSTVTGAVQVRKAREKNIFGKTREQMARGKTEKQKQAIYKNMQQMYDSIWSAYHKYRELKNQDPHAYYEDSMSVLSMLGQNVTSGISEDEAVANAVREMETQYEEKQQEYNDLFGDDFTDFGNFDV
jgi:hypothetical protein